MLLNLNPPVVPFLTALAAFQKVYHHKNHDGMPVSFTALPTHHLMIFLTGFVIFLTNFPKPYSCLLTSPPLANLNCSGK